MIGGSLFENNNRFPMIADSNHQKIVKNNSFNTEIERLKNETNCLKTIQDGKIREK